MIINYFAAQQGVVYRTDPTTLNDWMAHNLTNHNSGYSSGLPLDDKGHVNWENPTHVNQAFVDEQTLIQYAKAHGIDMALDSLMNGKNKANDDLLNKAMCDLNPAILGVNAGGHFVVASGKTKVRDTETWRLHDPLASAPTNLLDAYGNNYGRLAIFSGNKPRSALLLSLYSPAEVVITDPQGRRAGLDPRTGTLYEEIPSSSYGQEFLAADNGTPEIRERKVLYIDSPLSGKYSVEAIGTASGIIGLDVVPIDTNGDGFEITVTDTVTPNVANSYQLTYSSTPGGCTQFVRLVPPPKDTKVTPTGVAVSSVLSTWPKERLIDGDITTVWSSNGHSDHFADSEWAALLLPNSPTIDRMRIYRRATGRATDGFPKDFVLLTSRMAMVIPAIPMTRALRIRRTGIPGRAMRAMLSPRLAGWSFRARPCGPTACAFSVFNSLKMALALVISNLPSSKSWPGQEDKTQRCRGVIGAFDMA